MSIPAKEKHFTTHEVAEMCHVTRGSVIRWINEGKLAACVTAGGHHRILSRDIASFLKTLKAPLPEGLSAWGETEKIPKVLIVEDEENICRLLRAFFDKNFPQCRVEEAREGFEAGVKLKNLRPDLLLLDLVLPGIDGFRVCQIIRGQSETKHARIIAMSGVPEENYEKRIRSLGADDFLFKPFSLDQLERKILRHLPWIKKNSQGEESMKLKEGEGL